MSALPPKADIRRYGWNVHTDAPNFKALASKRSKTRPRHFNILRLFAKGPSGFCCCKMRAADHPANGGRGKAARPCRTQQLGLPLVEYFARTDKIALAAIAKLERGMK
jgi:hypothetical protein